MNKRYILLIILIFWGIFIFPQTVVSGGVKDEAGKPIGGAVVNVKDSADNTLGYAITGQSGSFSIQINSSQEKLRISVRKMNFAFIDEEIANKTQHLDFTLFPKTTEIKEIIVTPPIRKIGDTISYSVASFAGKKDRSIADVLAKMPGVEVQGDGRVLYQGKPIQKYYIEGMDLLEGRYNLANQNLPHQDVSAVQILENHQPVKVLDSLVPSDRASLNIKLKNAITITGTAKLGAGFSPLLRDVKATPMVFRKKQQMIASLQSANTGYDPAAELNVLTIEDFLNGSASQPGSPMLQIVSPETPPISEKRFLDNNANMLTINHLTKLKQDLEMKVNLSYLNDYRQQNAETATTYYLPDGNVLLSEKISNRIFINSLKTSIILEQNTKRSYLKNSFKITADWGGKEGNLQSNDAQISQTLENSSASVSNYLRLITPIGKQMITFSSYFNYSNSPQNLRIIPGVFPDLLSDGDSCEKLLQTLNQSVFQTNNYAEFTKGFKLFTFSMKTGMQVKYQQTKSNIFTNQFIDNQKFTNNNKSYFAQTYLSPSFSYKNKGLTLLLSMPLNYNQAENKDDNLSEKQSKNRFSFNPSINSYYEMKFWKFSLSAGIGSDFQNTDRILYGYFLSNYRNLQKNNFPISMVKNRYGAASWEYRNPVKSLFFNALYSVSRTENPYILQSEIRADGTADISVFTVENQIDTQNFTAKISKYFSRLKTTFALGASFSQNNYKQLINNELAKISIQNFSPNFKINSDITDDFGFEYSIAANFSANRSLQKTNLFSLNQNLSPNLYISDNQYVGINLEHYYNDFFSEKKHNFYMDLRYRFSFRESKTDLEFSCTNLFNQKQYGNSTFTDFYLIQNQYVIRQRQFLASIKFRF